MSGESEYVEGALYRATLSDGQVTIAMCLGATGRFVTDKYPATRSRLCTAYDVTDIVGPLRVLAPDERVVEPGQVVLDLDPFQDCPRLSNSWQEVIAVLRRLESLPAANIAEQIERQVQSPRIPEPGWGAIVEASVEGRPGRLLFAQHTCNGMVGWQSQDGCTWVLWDSLIDPAVKREGVDS